MLGCADGCGGSCGAQLTGLQAAVALCSRTLVLQCTVPQPSQADVEQAQVREQEAVTLALLLSSAEGSLWELAATAEAPGPGPSSQQASAPNSSMPSAQARTEAGLSPVRPPVPRGPELDRPTSQPSAGGSVRPQAPASQPQSQAAEARPRGRSGQLGALLPGWAYSVQPSPEAVSGLADATATTALSMGFHHTYLHALVQARYLMQRDHMSVARMSGYCLGGDKLGSGLAWTAELMRSWAGKREQELDTELMCASRVCHTPFKVRLLWPCFQPKDA